MGVVLAGRVSVGVLVGCVLAVSALLVLARLLGGLPAYHNVEVIEWVDWRGRPRRIVIRRRVGWGG
jgi:hypothetical protein